MQYTCFKGSFINVVILGNKKHTISGGFLLERVSRIELPSRPWQGRVIATIPHPPTLAVASFGGQARLVVIAVL